MNKIIRVHVESMCFTDKLGMEFELPASKELEEAILTINKACSDEVQRRKKDGPFLQAFDEFKWEAVQKYMSDNNWTWRDGKVPTIKQMKETVKNLYKSLDKHGTDSIGTGGFWVIRNSEEVRIEFTISSHGYKDIE